MTVPKGDARQGSRSRLSREAGHWLLRLQDHDPDRETRDADPAVRHEAFLDWLTESPEHVQAFLEIFETYRRLGTIDSQKQIQIEALLPRRPAEVIRIYGTPERTPTALAAPAAAPPRPHRRRVWAFLAAVAFAAIAASLVSVFDPFGSAVYTTAIGEQRTCKLQDGSMVYLNTDSRLEVEFTKALRGVRLVRGEALFVVEHDTRRPFIVTSGDARVRAVGTQFDVKTLGNATDVAVVEGVVQVTVTDAGTHRPTPDSNATPHASSETPGPGDSKAAALVPPLRLAAGERVKVAGGRVAGENARTDVADVMLWRQRRLKFRDTSLAEAAAEFNRYNDVQIIVDASVPDDKRLTGIFDADRPQSFVLYAAKDDGLVVEPAGHHWIIRSR